MTNCSLVITTTDDIKIAEDISKKLVEESVARCVWRDDVTSTYEWEGKVKSSKEYRLFIKTTKDKFEKIESIIKNIHNYDLPAIIEVDLSNGNKEFLEWLKGR